MTLVPLLPAKLSCFVFLFSIPSIAFSLYQIMCPSIYVLPLPDYVPLHLRSSFTNYVLFASLAVHFQIRRNKVPIQQLPDTLGSNFRSGTESRSQKLPSSLPMELSVESSESDMPHPLSKTTAAPLGAGPGVFHDRMMCLEQGLALPISEARDAPPKSAVSLRRSIRLSASGRRLGDHSIHVRVCERNQPLSPSLPSPSPLLSSLLTSYLIVLFSPNVRND